MAIGVAGRDKYEQFEREWPHKDVRVAQDKELRDCKGSIKATELRIKSLQATLDKRRAKGSPAAEIKVCEDKLKKEQDKFTRESVVLKKVSDEVECRLYWTSSMLALAIEPAWLATKTEVEEIFEAASIKKFGYPSSILYMPPTSPSKLRVGEQTASKHFVVVCMVYSYVDCCVVSLRQFDIRLLCD